MRKILNMTSSRYTAHTEYGTDRVVLMDKRGENSKVVEFTAEQGDAIIEHAQAFLDAGIARYGSLEAFDRACRWYLDVEAARA